jgi:ribosomal protein L7Ae-like RNA K-turn-binding protein
MQQNMKQKEDLSSTRRFKCPKLFFVGAKTLMKAIKRGDAFLIYVFPSVDVKPHPPKTPS